MGALEIVAHPLFGSVFAMISLVLAVYFYVKSRQFSRVSVHRHNSSIVGKEASSSSNDLEIRYKDRVVSRVNKAIFYIWNSGTQTIDGSQILATDVVRFEINTDGEILDAECIKRSREANGVAIKTSPAGYYIDFDFLDQNDGFVVQIFHSAQQDKLIFSGTIKGLPQGFNARPARFSTETLLIFKIMRRATKQYNSLAPYLTFILGLSVIIYGLRFYDPEKINNIERNSQLYDKYIFAFMGITYMILSAILIWSKRRKYPPSLSID